MSRTFLPGLALALSLVAAGSAEAKQWRYAGLHPLDGRPKGGLCHIGAVHVHTAAPVHAELMYRQHEGAYVFIGDPTPFGYEGERYSFYGHHPVVLSFVLGEEEPEAEEPETYCYHDGPHYHAYAPPEGHDFSEKEDVAYYTGEYPETYKKERPQRDRVDVVYAEWRAPRPVVRVAPPPEYHGPIVQVSVNVPLPSVTFAIGTAPAPRREVVREVIVVEEEHHHDAHCHHKHKKHKKWKGRD